MRRVAYLLKSNKVIYQIYYILGSTVLRILGFFLPTDEKLILFSSFGGKKYDDSPKAIYEEMKTDARFSDYRMIWSIQDPSGLKLPDDIEVVRTDTPSFFLCALKAKYWITNSSMERGLKFKKPNTIYFNTWHGSAIKKMGTDIAEGNGSFKASLSEWDFMLAQGEYDVEIFSRALNLSKDKFRCIGLPRNDILANYTEEDKREIRDRLGIAQDKTVILYAPTYREYEKGNLNQCVLSVPIDTEYWNRILGDNYVVLFRAHYEVAEHMNVEQCPLFRDMSNYPVLNDLMIAADMLVTDYSSVAFDYAITGKPIYCFAYDYEQYSEKRGLYLDLNTEMPCGVVKDQESLLRHILEDDYSFCSRQTQKFCEKYVSVYGRASELSCDLLYETIGHHSNCT